MKESILTLLNAANQELGNNLVQTDLNAYVDKIIQHAKIITVNNASKLEAFIAYYDNEHKKETAFLTMLAVDVDSRKKGYAKRLLQFAIDDLKATGFSNFRLNVLSTNIAAIRLYQSVGFNIENNNEAILIMELKLV